MFKKTNKKITALFRLWKRKRSKPQEVTPQVALEIQKQNFTDNQNTEPDSSTPPYIQIASDLSAENLQIFEATVFYLCRMAKLKPKYAPAIVDILQTYILANPKKEERIEIIENYYKKNAINNYTDK